MSLREDEDWNELYELQTDPGETEHIFDDLKARSVRSDLIETTLRRMISRQDRAPLLA